MLASGKGCPGVSSPRRIVGFVYGVLGQAQRSGSWAGLKAEKELQGKDGISRGVSSKLPVLCALVWFPINAALEDHGGCTGHWWQANHKVPGSTSSCFVGNLELLSAPKHWQKTVEAYWEHFQSCPKPKKRMGTLE